MVTQPNTRRLPALPTPKDTFRPDRVKGAARRFAMDLRPTLDPARSPLKSAPIGRTGEN